MMRAAIVAGLVMTAGAALGQSWQNTDWKAVDECYRKNVAELDDMTSDAETIAGAVSFNCQGAERAFARVGRLEAETAQAHGELRPVFLARATTAVLVRRVMIRKGELKP